MLFTQFKALSKHRSLESNDSKLINKFLHGINYDSKDFLLSKNADYKEFSIYTFELIVTLLMLGSQYWNPEPLETSNNNTNLSTMGILILNGVLSAS
jgi:hypothetical protein